jgi:hypothetical protein
MVQSTLFSIPTTDGYENILVKSRAPSGLDQQHFSACFAATRDTVVALGGYDVGDKNRRGKASKLTCFSLFKLLFNFTHVQQLQYKY